MDAGLWKCCACLACVLICVCIPLYGASFHTIYPNEVGVLVNKLTKNIDDLETPYTAGRYFTAIHRTFEYYPLTLQLVEFSTSEDASEPPLQGTTAGGQEITTSISVYYRLKAETIIDLYTQFKVSYQNHAARLIETVIKNNFKFFLNTQQYFEDRNQFAAYLKTKMNIAFEEGFSVKDDKGNPTGDKLAYVQFVWVRNIDPAAKVDQQVINKLRAEQITKTVGYEAEQNVINAEILKNFDIARSQVGEINSKAEQEAVTLLADSNARSISIINNASSIAYAQLKTELSYTSPQLLKHLYYQELTEVGTEGQVSIGVDNVFMGRV